MKGGIGASDDDGIVMALLILTITIVGGRSRRDISTNRVFLLLFCGGCVCRSAVVGRDAYLLRARFVDRHLGRLALSRTDRPGCHRIGILDSHFCASSDMRPTTVPQESGRVPLIHGTKSPHASQNRAGVNIQPCTVTQRAAATNDVMRGKGYTITPSMQLRGSLALINENPIDA